MTDVLVQEEPLVICDYQLHPKGMSGCFRCIDEELLERLLSMVDENKVKVFPVPVISPVKVDSAIFFRFLHDNNICFKIFFNESDIITEYKNVEILKTIPSVEAESKQAVVEGQGVVEVEEQPNFLQKFTTYYEYEYEADDGSVMGKSCAFMLEFTDNVKILQSEGRKIVTNQIYIILNKLCNSKITTDQIISEKFYIDITNALKILNGNGYEHGDIRFNNIVDCGNFSIPQYKLIDFGLMRKVNNFTNDIGSIVFQIEYIKKYPGQVDAMRGGNKYKDNFNKNFTTLRGIFKFEDQWGGQIRCKSKRSRCKKNGTRARTGTRTGIKYKLKNKHKTRTKSKSKNKRRTRRK